MAFLVGFDIEIGASQLDVDVEAKFTHKRLVAVSLVAAQVEVAVGSDAVAAQRRKHSQHGGRVGASADSSQNLSVGDSRWIYLSVFSSNAFIINLSIGKFKKSISINQNIFLPLHCLCNKK